MSHTMHSAFQPNIKTETIHFLLSSARLHHMLFDRLIGKYNLHRSQHRMLMYLSGQEQIPSQKQIADQFEISPAAVAVTLKKLENNGFIERITSKSDNRFNEIRITEKGRNVVEETIEYFAYIDNAMFRDFSEEELQTLRKLVIHTSENLKAAIAEITEHENADDIILNKKG